MEDFYMKNGEHVVREIMQKKKEVRRLSKEIVSLEKELHGIEIKYKGKHSIVECVDGLKEEVELYVEDKDGYGYSVFLHLSELLEIITK
jgi:uncharacterized protein YigE (DUF2233 family)